LCGISTCRHVEDGKGDQIAFIWEGDDPNESREITYRQLLKDVCKFANALKKLGVKKGDRVCIFLPMIPELPVAMLACARIGAIHSVVFGGFSADSLLGRISDSKSRLLITADYGLRGKRPVPLKDTADQALDSPDAASVEKVIVVRRTGGQVKVKEGRDLWWHDLTKGSPEECPCESMEAEDPLSTPRGAI
jgi:acetyl-CoA synthetase